MAGEKVSNEDIEKVLKKARRAAEEKKSEERIVDKGGSKKTPPLKKPKDKLDIILEEIQGVKKGLKEYQGKTDKLEQVYNRSVTPGQTKGGGSGTTGKTNEELLKEAEREQEEGEGTERPKGQITQEEYQALSAEEKVKFWEEQAKRTAQGATAEQALAERNRGQPPQSGAGKTGINPQYVYLLTKTIENLGPIVQAAIAKGGGGEKSGESLEGLGKELVIGLLRKSIDGQIGGAVGDGTKQLELFNNMQNQLLGGFFNTLKLLGKEPAQKLVTGIFTGPGAGDRINP